MDYVTVKWLHILSSTVLFGTGLGSAYYLFSTSLTRDAQAIALVADQVVRADWWFTTPTIVFQPVSGFYLMYLAGYPLSAGWIAASLLLYLLAGACWLPVLWLQLQMRDMARMAAAKGDRLPKRYWHFLRIWTALGIAAFLALLAVFYLMVARPA